MLILLYSDHIPDNCECQKGLPDLLMRIYKDFIRQLSDFLCRLSQERTDLQ
jgi:hypothetical protein